jgi:hypothetical protein
LRRDGGIIWAQAAGRNGNWLDFRALRMPA